MGLVAPLYSCAEIEVQSDGSRFSAFTHRYPAPTTSPSPLYYSIEVGTLCTPTSLHTHPSHPCCSLATYIKCLQRETRLLVETECHLTELTSLMVRASGWAVFALLKLLVSALDASPDSTCPMDVTNRHERPELLVQHPQKSLTKAATAADRASTPRGAMLWSTECAKVWKHRWAQSTSSS